jgi:hypothetical protein
MSGVRVLTGRYRLLRKGKIMQGEIERDEWREYLDGFGKRNGGRAAHVEVISIDLGAQELAEKLPLEGVTFEDKGSLAPSVEILLGTTATRHLTHTLTGVQRIVPKVGADGREDALEIESADGTKTIILFETLPALPETAA